MMFGNAIEMMGRSLDYLWKKQEITSNNISNIDTPGYKRKRVEFEDLFRRKLATAAQTGTREEIRQAIHNTPDMVIKDDTSVRADKNGVNADVEYTELTRTALQYQYLVQSVNADITRYRSVIKGQ